MFREVWIGRGEIRWTRGFSAPISPATLPNLPPADRKGLSPLSPLCAVTDAMTTLGDPLSANSVQIIAQAFDIHGSVDKEQFMQIVSVRSPAGFSSLERAGGAFPVFGLLRCPLCLFSK